MKRIKKGGRISKSDAELEIRRGREFRLWSMGVTEAEIAREYGVSFQTVNSDIAAIKKLETSDEAKGKIISILKEVIRTAFEKINSGNTKDGTKDEYMRIITEATSKIAKIYGLEKDSNSFYLSQTINNLAGEKNPYANWDDNRFREEDKRRRLLLATGKDKESKE